uniref:Transmembrane protein n=1 Tax=Steinernema glaseri TaxID=37863 RepID=A0A1I8ALF0_9BILA
MQCLFPSVYSFPSTPFRLLPSVCTASSHSHLCLVLSGARSMARCQYLPLVVGLFTSAMSVVLFALLEHLNHSSASCRTPPDSNNPSNGVNLFLCHSAPSLQSDGLLHFMLDILWTCLTSLPTGLVIVLLQVVEAVLEIRKKKKPTRFVRVLAFVVHFAIAIGLALSHEKPSEGREASPVGLSAMSATPVAWSVMTWTLFVAAGICVLHLLMFVLLWKLKKEHEENTPPMVTGPPASHCNYRPVPTGAPADLPAMKHPREPQSDLSEEVSVEMCCETSEA